MNPRWRPSVTVAAIVEKDGRYLLIEEHTPEGLRLNNPAGHLDPGESPEAGCAREAFEETTHRFTPTELVGIYISRFQRPAKGTSDAQDITYLRFAYGGVLGEAFRKARNVRFCVLSFTSDWLYPTTESRDIVRALNAAGARASFVEIESDKGHDAFLLHEPIMEAALGGFLSSAAKARGLEP